MTRLSLRIWQWPASWKHMNESSQKYISNENNTLFCVLKIKKNTMVNAVSATNNSPRLRLMFSPLIFSIIHYAAFMRTQLLPLFVPVWCVSVFSSPASGVKLSLAHPPTCEQERRNCTCDRMKGYKGWKSLFKLFIVFWECWLAGHLITVDGGRT